jgi:membrane protease YdiL (CAAX protease family)
MIIAIAWFAILVSSPLSDALVNRVVSISNPDVTLPLWSDLVKIAILSLLLVIVSLRPHLRPIRGFVMVVFAYSVGYLLVHLFKATPLWIRFSASAPKYEWVLAESLLHFTTTLLMVVTALTHGPTRKDLFLTKGDLSVSTRWHLFGLNISWYALTALFAILILCMAGGFLVMRLNVGADDRLLSSLIGALPFIILFPILNAINEEVRFRNALLAEAEPVVGDNAALLMTTALFGLVHFGGFLGTSGPGGSFLSGLTYAGGAACMGWINGQSILKTRGILAAWIIHASADLAIILGYVLIS